MFHVPSRDNLYDLERCACLVVFILMDEALQYLLYHKLLPTMCLSLFRRCINLTELANRGGPLYNLDRTARSLRHVYHNTRNRGVYRLQYSYNKPDEVGAFGAYSGAS
jgi:hypothetical protein